jgi:hypothetical protein
MDRGHDGALTGAWPPAAPVRQSMPAGAQKGERSMGSSAWASLELDRCCSNRATVVQNREVAALGERAAQAWREGKKERGEVRLNSVRVVAFYRGPGERRGGEAGAINAGVNGFNAIDDGPA